MAHVPSPEAAPDGNPRYRARVLQVESFAEIAREIERTESDPEGVGIMTRKARIFPVRLDSVPLKASPILKQEMLAVGADAAQARGVAGLSVPESRVVLLGTFGQYRRVLPKLARQPFHLKEIAASVDAALRHFTAHAPRTVRGAHRTFTVGGDTRVMGVVNVTPDSFSDGGRFESKAAAVEHALKLEAEGADLIDIGGESTRPGATPVSPDVEWGRVGPVLAALHGRLKVPLSIDTRHWEVADQAIDAGADIVNDIQGLRDPAMRQVVARTGAAAVVMHLRGTPATMQADLHYEDLRGEVFGALADWTSQALRDGVPPDRILVDPGLGFGKSGAQNLELLRHVGEFRSLGFPVLVGASRKSFLGSVIGVEGVDERLEAGIAAAVLAAQAGAAVIRTHDVRPTKRALSLADAVRRGGGSVSAPESADWSSPESE